MNNINRILNLIKKTGDKMIITDPDIFGDQDFVIMPLNDYEKIVEGKSDYSRMSEKELFDSVERDISLWRAEHDDYEDMEPPMPEPWEMERPWEHEPLPWDEDFDRVGDRIGDRIGRDEIEDIEFGEFDEFDKEDEDDDEDFVAPRHGWDGNEIKEDIKGNKFSIPEERVKGHRLNEQSEPIKYEDISLPPDINIEDIMDDKKEKEEIIDMSFEDEGDDFSEKEDEDEEFMTEVV